MSSSLAAAKPSAQPDPKELIGQEIVGQNYPLGWKRANSGNGGAHSEKFRVTSEVLGKSNTYVFVLAERSDRKDEEKLNRSKILAVARLSREPAGGVGGYDFVFSCEGPAVTAADSVRDGSQRVMTEVRFGHCQKYSKNISKAWLIDMKNQTIEPVSSRGMICRDAFFNNGPDGPKCPPIK